VARAHKARIGSDVSVLIDGPSAEHEMVLQGRLEGQAPDIDSVVYLTDCDPSVFETGALIRARVVGAKGYDLVAAPL
jgi:ribosomal protein S12 methylthiotransferase